MKKTKITGILLLLLTTGFSMNASAGFLYKYPIAGVVAENATTPEPPIEEPEEPDNSAWEQFAEDNGFSAVALNLNQT